MVQKCWLFVNVYKIEDVKGGKRVGVKKSQNFVNVVSEWLISGDTVKAINYGNTGFQVRGTKLERFLPKNQHTQKELFNFENWCYGEVSKSASIWVSKSMFYVKNHWNLSCFFSINLGAHFLWLTFFDNINFKSLSYLKWCPIFDTSQLHLKFCTPFLKIKQPVLPYY